jgi:hypothetical protein
MPSADWPERRPLGAECGPVADVRYGHIPDWSFDINCVVFFVSAGRPELPASSLTNKWLIYDSRSFARSLTLAPAAGATSSSHLFRPLLNIGHPESLAVSRPDRPRGRTDETACICGHSGRRRRRPFSKLDPGSKLSLVPKEPNGWWIAPAVLLPTATAASRRAAANIWRRAQTMLPPLVLIVHSLSVGRR